jgi:hypothetical protein
VTSTAGMVQRVLALAGIALLAGVGIFTAHQVADRSSGPDLPAAIPAPDGGWYEGIAARGGGAFATDGPTDCGHVLRAGTIGIAHPVLPCDVKLYLRYGGREVLTQVLSHGPRVAGRDFELTPALARALHLQATAPIEWRYAR